MKHIIGLLISVILSINYSLATKYALVIGIGNYPVESGWTRINGHKDPALVTEMLLVNGFEQGNITILIDQQATCNNICKEFEKLIDKSLNGDFVYIHFSGHGQQITDLNGDEIKDGLDEAWVSYDALFSIREGEYEGEHHLVDDQINTYLNRIRKRVGDSGKIVVIADACHSGTITRSVDGLCMRGTNSIFTISQIKNTIKRFLKIFKKTQSNIDQSHILPPEDITQDWIFISACKDYQINYEYQGRGSLTTALYQQKDSLSCMTVEALFKKVQRFMLNNINFSQTPQIECPIETKTNSFL